MHVVYVFTLHACSYTVLNLEHPYLLHCTVLYCTLVYCTVFRATSTWLSTVLFSKTLQNKILLLLMMMSSKEQKEARYIRRSAIPTTMRRELSFSFVDNDGEASDFYSNKPETQRAGVGGIAAFAFSQSQNTCKSNCFSSAELIRILSVRVVYSVK